MITLIPTFHENEFVFIRHSLVFRINKIQNGWKVRQYGTVPLTLSQWDNDVVEEFIYPSLEVFKRVLEEIINAS